MRSSPSRRPCYDHRRRLRALGQGARHLRARRRAAAARRDRPAVRLRRRAAHAHPRQGPRADRPVALLVRRDGRPRRPTTCWAPTPRSLPAAFAAQAAELRGRIDDLPPRRACCRSRSSSAATSRGVAGRTTSAPALCAASRCRRACARASGCRSRCSRRRPRPRGRARREHRLRRRWSRSSVRRWPSGPATWPSRSTGSAATAPRPSGSSWPTPSSSSALDAATGELILIDEVLTPDSSRFWELPRMSRADPGLVRQAVRARLAGGARLGQGRARARAAGRVVAGTRARYVEAFERITGASFERYLAGGPHQRERPSVRRCRDAQAGHPRPPGPGRRAVAAAPGGERGHGRARRSARRADRGGTGHDGCAGHRGAARWRALRQPLIETWAVTPASLEAAAG